MSVTASDSISCAVFVQHEHLSRSVPPLKITTGFEKKGRFFGRYWSLPEMQTGLPVAILSSVFASGRKVCDGQRLWGHCQYIPPFRAFLLCLRQLKGVGFKTNISNLEIEAYHQLCQLMSFCPCWPVEQVCVPDRWPCRRPSPNCARPARPQWQTVRNRLLWQCWRKTCLLRDLKETLEWTPLSLIFACFFSRRKNQLFNETKTPDQIINGNVLQILIIYLMYMFLKGFLVWLSPKILLL